MPDDDKPRPLYRVTLSPLPDCAPPHVALKRLLKCALRVFGLRAVKVEQLDAPATPDQPASD